MKIFIDGYGVVAHSIVRKLVENHGFPVNKIFVNTYSNVENMGFVNYLNDTVFKTDWDEKVDDLSGTIFGRPLDGSQRLVASYLSYSNKITISINDISDSTIQDLSGIELHFGLPSGTVVFFLKISSVHL